MDRHKGVTMGLFGKNEKPPEQKKPPGLPPEDMIRALARAKRLGVKFDTFTKSTSTPDQVVTAQFGTEINPKQRHYLITIVQAARNSQNVNFDIQSAPTYGLKLDEVRALAQSQYGLERS
jgi:hypothetical protein